jgi:two-component system, sensor histidine kinase and response regulator
MAEATNVGNLHETSSAFDWSGKAILVVEDDRTHRSLVEKILKDCLFNVSLAEDGLAALARLEAGEKFDLILMDMDMPGMGGLETAKEIRKKQTRGGLPYIPIVAFTANRKKDDREKCLRAGMDAYLPKDVWLPKWRQTLIDNLFQGRIAGNSAIRQTNDTPSDNEREETAAVFDIDAFDAAAFEQTVLLLREDLPIAVEEFLEDAAAYIREIREGLEGGDTEKAARGSHPLKSNSKSFGLTSVSRIAEAINTAVRQGDLKIAVPLLPQLQEAFHRAERKLREAAKAVGADDSR